MSSQKTTSNKAKEIDTFGGQAVIEGVMMRNKTHYAIACRTPQGKIVVQKKEIHSLAKKHSFLAKPFLRGALGIFEMMVLGLRAITYSANVQATKKEEKLSTKEITGTMISAFLIAIALFVIAPYFLTGIFIEERGIFFNLIDGIIRLVFFLVYLLGISFMKEVQRLFQYHGAEHMTVYCVEAKKKLNVQNVSQFRPEHPRCGTSFLVIVLCLSILIFSLIKTPLWYLNIPLRILFVPVIAGVGYEVLKFSAKHQQKWWLRWITFPGLWVQKITTKKPDKKQMEVAIAAISALL